MAVTAARYRCCDLQRRQRVLDQGVLNGLDALEVIDRDLPELDPLRQRTLLLFFLRPVAGAGFTRDNLKITGGVRVRDPRIEWAGVASGPLPQLLLPGEADTAAIVAALAQPDQVLVVRVAQTGDYSNYTLTLRRSLFDEQPPLGFDPRMVAIDFSFKAECPSDFDCPTPAPCAPPAAPAPEIDYLARDFATFRRLLLSRMSQLAPDWNERSLPDGGIALVELLAWAGDQLAYRQDAIATEAYLATARLRTSLRRHAQLVDYPMHDGRNARCFVHLRLRAGTPMLALPRATTQFLTRCGEFDVVIDRGSARHDEALALRPVVFEPLHDVQLFEDLNELHLHTWGDERCCLPKGATRATLIGAHPLLHEGQWLLFEEIKGPRSGAAGDADPRHRQVVRLTKVWASVDPLPNPDLDVTEIEWHAEDALQFPLCVSAVSFDATGNTLPFEVSVARGNIVLADHGRSLQEEGLGRVAAPHLFEPVAASSSCDAQPPRPIPARFTPVLHEGPLTQATVWSDKGSALQAMAATAEVLPAIRLSSRVGTDPPRVWKPVPNLFNSFGHGNEFVAEVEDGGRTTLRFGDGSYGRRPETGATFKATYRVGNGREGNLGAGALFHVAGVALGAIESLRNPLPAVGGLEPESAESVRRRAPEAFRRIERAVTPADYNLVTERASGVQRASSRLRWTGSWHSVFITVDRSGGTALDADSRQALIDHVDGYRMAGHDIALREPAFVSLELRLHVCVAEGAFRSEVRAGLLEVLGAGLRRDGQQGLFHPDRFSFGQPVYLSPLIAAARTVAGVASLEVLAFGRQGSDDPLPLLQGVLTLGPREIARLENDPNFPEHGLLVLELHGGQ